MPLPYSPSQPEGEQVALFLPDDGIELRSWTRYSVHTDYLTPTDGWEFSIGDGNLAESVKKSIGIIGGTRALGRRVQLKINNNVQLDGLIDSIEISATRSAGTEYTIRGRDRLAAVVDSVADPTQQFKEGATLAEVLKAIFGPFGWENDDDFVLDNGANRSAKSGIRSAPVSKKGKTLKDYVLHQLKPYPQEGAYHFAARIAERHGLTIRCSGDGKKIIVTKPDFDQSPSYKFLRNALGTTNVLSGSVKFDMTDQPTVIVADGVGGGGEFGHSSLRTIVANPAFYTDDPAFLEPFKKYKGAKLYVDLRPVGTPVKVPRNRTLFIHDEQSKTQDQLDNFLRKKLSEYLRRSLQATYVAQGHGQLVDDTLRVFDIDTIVDVKDDVAGLDESLWVMARTFSRSRSSGTTTSLDLVRRGSIDLGEMKDAPRLPVVATSDATKPLHERRFVVEQLTKTPRGG